MCDKHKSFKEHLNISNLAPIVTEQSLKMAETLQAGLGGQWPTTRLL